MSSNLPNCWCHLCNRIAEEEFYIEHLQIHHPTTLFVLYATHATHAPLSLSGMRYTNTIPYYLNSILQEADDLLEIEMEMELDETSEYERLLEMCDRIGYHKIGVDDMTTVTSVRDKASCTIDDICPVCMDVFIENEKPIYTLNKCKHSYCKECIEKWCEENKICPVCKIEIV